MGLLSDGDLCVITQAKELCIPCVLQVRYVYQQPIKNTRDSGVIKAEKLYQHLL